jgi:hypothetical protein
MKKLTILWGILLLVLQLQGQEAVFKTDTKYMFHGAKTQEDSLHALSRYAEAEWLIHGQQLTWVTGKVAFVPDPMKIDTLFFKQSSRHGWDTLLCNVKYPGEYVFVFNECCGGFYLVNKNFKWVTDPVVDFWVKGGGNYFAAVNQEGTQLKSGVTTRIDSVARGAMDPNVYRVTLEKGTPCKSEADSCHGSFYLQEGIKQGDYVASWYEPQMTICSFLYIDVWGEPLNIWYDEKQKKLEIQ